MPVISLTAFNQLKKIMALTTSANDGERLSAITAANKLLAANKLDWNMVLSKLVTLEMEPTPAGMTDEEKDQAIAQAFYKLNGTRNPFIQSLKDQYERTGFLSKDQRARLFENAERVK